MFNTLPPPLLSRRRPSMETPLDVLSRAASFVHANEEESKCLHTTSSSFAPSLSVLLSNVALWTNHLHH